jgi:hypothetical protein
VVEEEVKVTRVAEEEKWVVEAAVVRGVQAVAEPRARLEEYVR